MKKRKIKLIIGLIIFGAFAYNVYPMLIVDSQCNTLTDFLKIDFRGRVVNKVIDHAQHGYTYVVVENALNKQIDTIDCSLDTSHFYDKVKISDTLLKHINSDTVYAIKNGKQLLVGSIDFGCDSK